MTNTISFDAGKLDVLAKRIRNGIDLREESDADWIKATLDLSAAMAEARDWFKADIAFGRWCDDSGFALSKDDRAAYIAFGRDLERARLILENTKSRSVEQILRREFRVRESPKPRKAKTDAGLTTSPAMQKGLDAYDALKSEGVEPTYELVEKRAGISSTAVRRVFERRRTEENLTKQEVDISDLPKGAKAKIEATVRKIQKQMDAEYDMRLQQGIRAFMAEHTIPLYAKKLAIADRIIAGKKPFSIEEYRKLLAALHPDNSSVERRNEMFNIVKERELMLRPADKDKPLSGDLPKTVEELLARRRKK